MRHLLLYLVAVIPAAAFSQEWRTVEMAVVKKELLAVSETFRKTDFSVEFERSIFRHYSDPQPMTSSKGFFARGKGKEYSSVSGGQQVIQTNVIKMVVDSAQKLIILTEPDTLFSPVDLSGLADQWENYKFQRYESATDINYRITKKTRESSGESMEIRIDKRTNQLVKFIMYMTPGNYFSESIDDETSEVPMIVVEYESRKSLIADKQPALELTKWVSVQNDSYTLIPSLADNYRFEDLRYKQPNLAK